MRAHILLACVLCAPALACAQEPAASVSSDRPKRITVRWPATNGAISYSVWRQIDGDPRWEVLTELGADARSYRDSRVRPDRLYRYRVDAGTSGRPIQGAVLGPVSPLEPFYVELRSVEGQVARVVVHKWDAGFGEWLKSDVLRARVGDLIGEQGMMADFRTGAKLAAAGISPELGASVQTITFTTAKGRTRTATTRDRLPLAVVPPKKKSTRQETETKPATTTRTRDPVVTEVPKERALPFPEPRRAGTAPGKRVYWEITNSSEFSMNVLIIGRAGKRSFRLKAGESYLARLKRGGKFVVSVQANKEQCAPLYGEFSLREGTRYASNLQIQLQEPAGD